MSEIPTKPYLIRALYEWCVDNGYRPYIAVAVDERTLVPREFVRDGEIVLNISAAATNRLTIGNELLEFEARFSGVARQVSVPIENVSAIFAQENGRGMAFEVPKVQAVPPQATETEGAGSDAASLPPEPEATEQGGVSAATRARKRPKLAAVPAPGEQAPKPARRKGRIAAVPAPEAADASQGERPTTPEARPEHGDGDEPGPDAPGPGRPRLTRVK